MRKTGRRNVTAAASVLSVLAAISAAADAQPGRGQPQLELIAAAPFDQAFKEGGTSLPAGPCSSWTPDQRRSMPAEVKTLCAGFWTFIDGADGSPTSRLLPTVMPKADEVQLVMDVCLIAHLPADWPERGARLQSAASILDRADRAGASLHLPAQLSR